MAEKNLVYKEKVKQKGIFGFKDFYEFIYDYLVDEGYDVHESKYREKVGSGGESKDVEISWSAKKAISGYFQYEISLSWLILGMKSVKVKKEDGEVKMDSGTIEVVFKATLIKDYKSNWDSKILQTLNRIYNDYVIKQRTEDHELILARELNDLISNVKSFLTLEGHHSFD
jgi:hypothetical protein